MIKTGTSRITINPEKGHNLAGYGIEYKNEGVHDDLSATALYLNDNQNEALFLSYDLIGMDMPYVLEIRAAISHATGIATNNIFLHNTHTHSGPEVRNLNNHLLDIPDKRVPAYQKQLIEWSCTVSKEARSNAENCDLEYNFDFAEENMNRRFNYTNREYRFIPSYKNLRGQSWEYVDRELGITVFRKLDAANKLKAIITNYTCHPLNVGNTSYLCTSDYHGVIRKTVEDTFAGCTTLTTTGAAADHHPLFPESGFAKARLMGENLGTIANARTFDAVKTDDMKLRMAYEKITLESIRGPIETEYSILGIGPIAYIGLPGEVTGILGAHVKYSSPFLKTYLCMTSTDNLFYLPARNQTLWGGYEAENVIVKPGETEKLISAVLESANKLADEDPIELKPVRNWREPQHK